MKSPAKKLLSFVLITVIAASVLPVYSAEAMDSTSLNDAANWYDGSSNQVSALPIAEEQSWSSVNNVTGDDVPGGAFESALRCNGNNCIAFGTKLMLEPNTTYTLSFSYYAETSAKISSESQNTACLKGVGAYPFSEELKWSDISGSMAPNNWNLCANTENKLFNIVCTDSAKVGSNITGLCNKPSGEWNEFSATFNSQNVTEALFYFNKQSTTVDNVYIADLKLIDVSELDGYKVADFTGASFRPSEAEPSDSGVLVLNYDEKFTNGSDTSFKYHNDTYGGFFRTFEVERDSDYLLSFDYYSDDELSTTEASSADWSYIISAAGIIKSGGAFAWNSEDNLGYVGYNTSYKGSYSEKESIGGAPTYTSYNVKKGEWNSISIPFSSGNEQNVEFVVYIPFNKTVYVDNIVMQKTSDVSGSLNDPSAWKLYKSSSTNIGENGTPVDDWAKVTENTDTAYIKDGDSSLNFSCISQHGAAEFEVEQNKNYIISFKYYSDSLNAAGTYILSQVAVMTPNGAVGYMSEDNLSYVSSGLSYTGPYSERKTNSNSTAVTETGWHDFEIGFNSGSHTKLALRILFAASPVYVDCIELNELSVNDGGVVEITSNKGQSIRTSEPMGLRFKSNIKKSLLESGVEGFKIVEFGSVAIRTAVLGEAELTLGSKGNNESGYEIAAKKGTAYKNDGTNLIFAEYDDSYDFTAVLINIGLQSNGRTDYGFFAQKYSVRTYAVLERAGLQITVYDDETVNASVFDVMKAILNGGQSDDKEAVTAMLSQNSEMLAAYQEFDPDFIL